MTTPNNNQNRNNRLRNWLIVLVLIVVYAYATEVLQIDLQEAIEPQRQSNLISAFREFARPDLFAYDTETRRTNISIRMPCPEDVRASQVTNEGRLVLLIPNCVSTTQDVVILEGEGFTPNAAMIARWYPVESETTRTLIDIKADNNGAFSAEFTFPDVRESEEAQRIEIVETVSRRIVGLSDTSREAIEKIIETIFMALMASTIGTILAVPISFIAARNLMSDIKMPLAAIMSSILLVVVGAGAGGWLASLLISPIDLSGLSRLGTELGPFNFIGNFIYVGLDLTVYMMPVFVGFIGMILGLTYGGRLGQRVIMQLPDNAARIVTFILTVAGTAVFLILLGLGLISLNLLGILEYAPETVTGRIQTLLLPTLIIAVVAGALSWLRHPKHHYPIGITAYTFTRGILNVTRSIEPIMMAFVFTVWIGLGPFAGILALTLHSVADLGKLFSEQVENINDGPREAVTAAGATTVQTIVYAVVPQITPHYIAYIFYRWDINVRMSTIIGFVGGGGIGFVLQRHLNQLRYSKASVMVITIAIVVVILDYVSSRIRSRII